MVCMFPVPAHLYRPEPTEERLTLFWKDSGAARGGSPHPAAFPLVARRGDNRMGRGKANEKEAVKSHTWFKAGEKYKVPGAPRLRSSPSVYRLGVLETAPPGLAYIL